MTKTIKIINKEKIGTYHEGRCDCRLCREYNKGRQEAFKEVEEIVNNWSLNSIVKYDSECSYCQVNVNTLLIYVKELKKELKQKLKEQTK